MIGSEQTELNEVKLLLNKKADSIFSTIGYNKL